MKATICLTNSERYDFEVGVETIQDLTIHRDIRSIFSQQTIIINGPSGNFVFDPRSVEAIEFDSGRPEGPMRPEYLRDLNVLAEMDYTNKRAELDEAQTEKAEQLQPEDTFEGVGEILLPSGRKYYFDFEVVVQPQIDAILHFSHLFDPRHALLLPCGEEGALLINPNHIVMRHTFPPPSHNGAKSVWNGALR